MRPCLPWDGDLNRDGYGRWGHDLAHRRAWMEHFGVDIPDGMTLDHRCHTLDTACRGLGALCPHRKCVEPTHMDLVPMSVNARRRWGRDPGVRVEPEPDMDAPPLPPARGRRGGRRGR